MDRRDLNARQPGPLFPSREWLNQPAEPAARPPIAAGDISDGPAEPPLQSQPARRPPAPRQHSRGQAIRRQLASPASLRLAILMAEILAPPKALRPDDH